METEVTSLTDSDLINSGLKISLELAEDGPEDKSWAGASSLVTLGHVNTELKLEVGTVQCAVCAARPGVRPGVLRRLAPPTRCTRWRPPPASPWRTSP